MHRSRKHRRADQPAPSAGYRAGIEWLWRVVMRGMVVGFGCAGENLWDSLDSCSAMSGFGAFVW